VWWECAESERAQDPGTAPAGLTARGGVGGSGSVAGGGAARAVGGQRGGLAGGQRGGLGARVGAGLAARVGAGLAGHAAGGVDKITAYCAKVPHPGSSGAGWLEWLGT
jgi:hypothetical protein